MENNAGARFTCYTGVACLTGWINYPFTQSSVLTLKSFGVRRSFCVPVLWLLVGSMRIAGRSGEICRDLC